MRAVVWSPASKDSKSSVEKCLTDSPQGSITSAGFGTVGGSSYSRISNSGGKKISSWVLPLPLPLAASRTGLPCRVFMNNCAPTAAAIKQRTNPTMPKPFRPARRGWYFLGGPLTISSVAVDVATTPDASGGGGRLGVAATAREASAPLLFGGSVWDGGDAWTLFAATAGGSTVSLLRGGGGGVVTSSFSAPLVATAGGAFGSGGRGAGGTGCGGGAVGAGAGVLISVNKSFISSPEPVVVTVVVGVDVVSECNSVHPANPAASRASRDNYPI